MTHCHAKDIPPGDDRLWYKDAVIYELHVRAFADSTDDGIGDFRGLTGKLDYLRDLGVTALWLLPFYPSPLRDDGYDISDYGDIHPDYGTVRDFKVFLNEAHNRDLRVITELVINHTSDRHPWFQRARRAEPGSPLRDFYVWSETPDRYKDARVIFKDFESANWTWDAVAKAYYWHRFYSHQPDLNFENPRVVRAVRQVLDYWLDIGVDGLRLDAVPYLFEEENTNCENLPRTHDLLKDLRRHVDEHYPGRMLLSEANQWPEDAIAYFGSGDESHMAFHFPVMPRLFMAVRMESAFPIIDILEQTPTIPESCQWAIFLRNHDELTLEMVTDEERDYMYRSYAYEPQMRINLGIRRRLAPLMEGDRRRIELLNGLLFSLPGTPVLYYGDEIGMGDNIYLGDRNGVRTPMQWNADRNGGFSRANPQKLYLPVIIDPEYHYEAVNVESQSGNPHSLLWWMRRLINVRRSVPAFGRGDLKFVASDNPKVLAFLRRHDDQHVLVVCNLSRFPQSVTLLLGDYSGQHPVEVFGGVRFPAVDRSPYILTLGPHTFYWLLLQGERPSLPAPVSGSVAGRPLRVGRRWESVLSGRARTALTHDLASYVSRQRWFGGKGKSLHGAELTQTLLIAPSYAIALVQIRYTEGEPEVYQVPLGFASGPDAERVLSESPNAVIAMLATPSGDGIIYDAVVDGGFRTLIRESILRRRRFRSGEASILCRADSGGRTPAGAEWQPVESRILSSEQSNTSFIYGQRHVFKLFRKVDPGDNPELEIMRFLTQRGRFGHIAPLLGDIGLQSAERAPIQTLGILQQFVPNQGDAWTHTLEILARFYEQAMTHADPPVGDEAGRTLVALVGTEIPDAAIESVGGYLETARALGLRTAEMHLALCSDPSDPNFAPEPFSALYQRGLYQAFRAQAHQALALLRRNLAGLPDGDRAAAAAVLSAEDQIVTCYSRLLDHKIAAARARCHGDFHLGQVLFTGKDYVIIDFEGEPARPLSERRLKRSPLRDVAGMLRSFDYAGVVALRDRLDSATSSFHLERWRQHWTTWVSVAYLNTYLTTVQSGPIAPSNNADLNVLLNVFLLQKAIYELEYELNSRPAWVTVPLQGILSLLNHREP